MSINKKKNGVLKTLVIGILGGLASLLLALFGIGNDRAIYWIQKLLFGSNEMIALVSTPFLSRFDGFIIGIASIMIVIASFFKFPRKFAVLVTATILLFLMIVSTIFSLTVFNPIDILFISPTHPLGISYIYSDVKKVELYYTISYAGRSRSRVMHYDLVMKDGNRINVNSDKGAADFKTELVQFIKIEERLKNVPHITGTDFLRYYGDLFPSYYFENFIVTQ